MPTSSKNPTSYNVHLDEATGYYYFLTDQGLIYTCGFDNLTPSLPPIVGIYDIEISDFIFTPQTGQDMRHDERVSATIVNLLQSYFENKSRVLIYLCDASDGRPRARQTLFSRWHRNMMDMIDHYPVQIPVHDAVVYGGMLTRKDFPYPEIVQEHLVYRAGELILEKFGR